MTDHALVKVDGRFTVPSLAATDPDLCLLLVIYPEGDCDTVKEPGDLMHRALYDLYQCSEGLKDGDTFSLDGTALYRCSGVHVVQSNQEGA